jgi:3',5'-cyclic AMP phosphodiesterase CpdA
MQSTARLLHVTDTHIFVAGGDHEPDDTKIDIQLPQQSRSGVLERLFSRIAESLDQKHQRLDGVIFSGDALIRGAPGGDAVLLDLIAQHFRLDGSRILSVPGNHDVVRGSQPGSIERYQDFLSTWRNAGCITPWLDGIDEEPASYSEHVLLAEDKSWAVMAVNSCNWSHVDSTVPDGLRQVWEQIPLAVAKGDPDVEAKIRRGLRGLIQHDAAHISQRQCEVIRAMFRSLPKPEHGRQLRMVALHHHLRDPSHRLEVKSMANLLTLEIFRDMLAELDIKVVFHGHKHVWRQHFDYVDREQSSVKDPHRVLIMSGGTFTDKSDSPAAGLVRIEGLPWTPLVTTSLITSQPGGLDLRILPERSMPIWDYSENLPGVPAATIQGSDLDEVYSKILAHCTSSKNAPLLVQLDLSSDAPPGQLPNGYPDLTPEQQRKDWLENLVKWWQRSDSHLEKRVPYIHGVRLQRYGNNVNQINNIIKLLKKKNTSRAVAVLLDPRQDFETEDTKFASFCLVQFSRRPGTGGSDFLDAIGYYRAQEMKQWWPINVQELRYLQKKIIQGGVSARPGRITTFTAEARVDTAPQPTHVAMPLIDRWLDQFPENFFVLATCMISGRIQGDREEQVAAEWMDELLTLGQSVQRTAGDGGPVVAIDGLNRLASFLEAGVDRSDDSSAALAGHLRDLAMSSAAPPMESQQLQAWQAVMQRKLTKVTDLSQKLLQRPPALEQQAGGD